MNQNILLAVVLTAVASVVFAVASVVQHSAVGDSAAKPGAKLSGSDLFAVIRNPRWLGGLLLTGVGAVMQTAALFMAPVTVVQPIGTLAVPWTILLAARVHKRPITAAMWVAAGLTMLGTAAFVTLIPGSRPSPSIST